MERVNTRTGGVSIVVTAGGKPVSGCKIEVQGPFKNNKDQEVCTGATLRTLELVTDSNGYLTTKELQPGFYRIAGAAFFQKPEASVEVKPGFVCTHNFELSVTPRFETLLLKADCTSQPCSDFVSGSPVQLRTTMEGLTLDQEKLLRNYYTTDAGSVRPGAGGPAHNEQCLDTFNVLGPIAISNRITDPNGAQVTISGYCNVTAPVPQTVAGNVSVSLQRSKTHRTADQALWTAIRNRTRAIAFGGSGYKSFIDRVLSDDPKGEVEKKSTLARQRSEADFTKNLQGVAAYDLLKTATEVFLLLECGVVIEEFDGDGTTRIFDPNDESRRQGEFVTLDTMKNRLTDYLGTDKQLPYIQRILRNAFPGLKPTDKVHSDNVLTHRADRPCLLELIWSYWHEEGMLVQSINAISRRFQNVRSVETNSGACAHRDPLAHLEIDPLRPVNNLLWGYMQDERNRLTVRRRAYEYEHHYGLRIEGKAVKGIRPADVRSKFLEAFHHLLHSSAAFFKEDNDTTVIADGYPLLNALREVHLILAQGAHNQFGDLPWTSRAEMLIQQWFMARPEIRDFLQSRHMVPYKEGWMAQVDTMKTMQGWTDVTVTHFRDLGVYGEQILLAVRYGDWIDVNEEDAAKNWARYWRPEIQGYIHSYRAVTGVDLSNADTVDYSAPSMHLTRRLASQRAR